MNTNWTMSALSDEPGETVQPIKKRVRRSGEHGTETILLVEDKSASRERLASTLAEKGYSVLTAGDGLEAVEQYRSFEKYVDLVIIDYSLPRLSGFDAAVTIRGLSSDVKVILMANDLATNMRDEMRESGINEILVKPFTMKEAMQAIRTVLEQDIPR